MRVKLDIYSLYSLIAAPKIHTDLLWDLTFLFVILCAIYFGVIFFFRRKLSLGSKTVRKRKKELSPMISEFLFYDENAPKDEKTNYVNLKIEIRELLNSPFNRRVLTDVLMDLRKDLSGGTLNKLFELYESLGLHHDSYKKLESWRWQKVSKGISQLTQMNVEESYVFITKFINDKRPTIRKQAEIAIISLKHEGLDFFLDTTTYRISEWQQLKILEVLKNKKNYQPPSFKQWLISKNKDVVLFALRLMKYYNQSDGNRALIELLKHKNGEIKVAAIGCIKEFHVVESIETLKLVFWDSSTDIKIALLDAISELGTDSDLQFLQTVSAKESNFNVKSKALSSINAIAPMTVMPTKGIQEIKDFKVVDTIKDEEKPEGHDENVAIEVKTEEDPQINQHAELPSEQAPNNEIVTVENNNVEEAEIPSNLEIDELLSIEVSDEELVQSVDSVLVASEKAQANEPSDDTTEEREDEHSFKFDFLPLVTSTEKEVEIKRYDPREELSKRPIDIAEIELVFEEIQDSLSSPAFVSQEELPDFDIEENLSFDSSLFDFLPIVVPSEEITNVENVAKEEVFIDPLKLEVFYTEVHIEEPRENIILSELNELVPLPSVPIEKTKTGKNVIQESVSPSSTKNIDMKKIKKIECEGVEIKIENQKIATEPVDTKSEDLMSVADFEKQEVQNTLDWVLAENEAKDELKQKIKSLVSNQNEEPFHIPKPIFYDEREANTIALLDDIEALGDQREVPLLKDLLTEEVELSIRKRIQELIEKITDTSVLKRESISQEDRVFSVFEEFFRGIDVPSKLILLDEIVAVGDEKEIPFLKRLTADSDKKVGKKAQYCLEKLTARLVKEKEEQTLDSPELKKPHVAEKKIESIEKHKEEVIEKPFDVFEIEFDFSLENQEETESKTTS